MPQQGIKWWKSCPVCRWAAKTAGPDNDLTVCPNCNNPNLNIEIDDLVFAGKRYDERVRNSKGQATADAARQSRGEGAAPADTDDRSNQGHDYGQGAKPFPDPT